MIDIVIIGGGISGLINAIQLSRAGFSVCLIEKKQYPFHKVCGEYISNEVVPFLKSIDAYPDFSDIPQINQLQLSDTFGRTIYLPLPLGGFGLSRYRLDDFLYRKAKAAGTAFLLGTQATDLCFKGDHFEITLSDGTMLYSQLVIGAYGKRSKIDKSLARKFIQERSPYIGLKYHIHYSQFPSETIALHNFKQGYCGVCTIEDGKQNLCYLSHRDNLRNSKNIKEMEAKFLFGNPHLERIFKEAVFMEEKPVVINEISFAPKNAVEAHVLMSGDAAGMIAPLCGNGMAMAIHGAKLLSELIITYLKKDHFDREALESAYITCWNKTFKRRLQIGRTAQRFFGHGAASAFTVALAKRSKFIADMIIRQTHGKPF